MNIDPREWIKAEGKSYKVKHGLITDPGKFEGEPIFAPYYYSLGLEGWASADEDGIYEFDVDDEDREAFPALKDVSVVFLTESDDGFVWHSTAGGA